MFRTATGLLPFRAVASTPSPDITLTPLVGEPRPLEEWLTTFHLASVVLDPYTNESSWILETAARILRAFRGSDARVNFVVTCSAADARTYLGPLAEEFLVFCDPDRAFVRGLGRGGHFLLLGLARFNRLVERQRVDRVGRDGDRGTTRALENLELPRTCQARGRHRAEGR